MATVPGAVPDGVTCSQPLPVVVLAEAVYVVCPDAVVSVTFWAPGTAAPIWYANDKAVGLAATLLTVSDTLIGTLLDGPKTVTVPWYGVMFAAKPVGSAMMLTAEGAVPLAGLTFSQGAFGNVVNDTGPPELVTVTDCDACGPPAIAEKLNVLLSTLIVCACKSDAPAARMLRPVSKRLFFKIALQIQGIRTGGNAQCERFAARWLPVLIGVSD